MFDVIVIGGSYAGISATLQLARARRTVLVLDAGQRRNRFAAHAHGFLGQDGQPPEAIAAKGRAEALAYPTVTWKEALVTEARALGDGFSVRAGEELWESKRVILATGVVDQLPAIPGLQERWGETVFHCPYCHGYELGRGRFGVLATNAWSLHQAALITEWAAPGQTVLFLNDALVPTPEELSDLEARGIQLEHRRVVAAEGTAPEIALRLEDGASRPLDGLFLGPQMVVPGPFPEQLGCTLETGPTGSYYRTDSFKETTVPGVFACGDGALMMGSLAFAVADGVMAGISAHRSLIFPKKPGT